MYVHAVSLCTNDEKIMKFLGMLCSTILHLHMEHVAIVSYLLVQSALVLGVPGHSNHL